MCTSPRDTLLRVAHRAGEQRVEAGGAARGIIVDTVGMALTKVHRRRAATFQ